MGWKENYKAWPPLAELGPPLLEALQRVPRLVVWDFEQVPAELRSRFRSLTGEEGRYAVLATKGVDETLEEWILSALNVVDEEIIPVEEGMLYIKT